MKKFISLILAFIILIPWTNSFAMSRDTVVSSGTSSESLHYQDSYASEMVLNYSGLSVGFVKISRNELIFDDITDAYPYLMLELKRPGDEHECYKEIAKVREKTAKFGISRVQPGRYRLFLYHNDSEYGTFDSVIYGDIELLIDRDAANIIKNPVYDKNCAIKSEEVLYDETFEYFLKPSDGIESDDPEIIQIARYITSSCKTPYQMALALNDFVAGEIFYNQDYLNGRAEYGNQSARAVLSSKIAVCEGYSALLAAMARAVGIPARQTHGISFKDFYTDLPFSQEVNHTWTELWVGRWLMVDCTWNSSNRYENGVFARGEISHDYFDMSLSFLSLRHLIKDLHKYNKINLCINDPMFQHNGKWLNCDYGTAPTIISNKTYIPRAVIESMGGTADFYPDGSYRCAFCVDGTTYYFTSTSQINRQMIPLRSVLEPIGCAITWDNGIVTIGYVD